MSKISVQSWKTRLSAILTHSCSELDEKVSTAVGVAIATITSALNLVVAIYVIVAWRDRNGCSPFSLMADDDHYERSYFYDCSEKVWFAIALICSLLWATAAACLLYFVKSGCHAKWEEKFLPSSSSKNSPVDESVDNAVVTTSTAVVESDSA